MDGKEIKPNSPKGNQSLIFIGRTDAKTEAPILWPLDVMSCLIGRDPDAWKDSRQKRRGQQGIRLLDSNTHSMDINLSKLWETVDDRGAWCATVHEVTESWT